MTTAISDPDKLKPGTRVILDIPGPLRAAVGQVLYDVGDSVAVALEEPVEPWGHYFAAPRESVIVSPYQNEKMEAKNKHD